MNGNFTFHAPTRLHFGENAMEFLKDELAAFGPTVQQYFSRTDAGSRLRS